MTPFVRPLFVKLAALVVPTVAYGPPETVACFTLQLDAPLRPAPASAEGTLWAPPFEPVVSWDATA